MTTESAIADILQRYKSLDDSIRAGKLDVDGAIGKYAWIQKDGRLGMAQLGAAIPTEADEKNYAVPFTISAYIEDRDGDLVDPMGCVLDDYAKNPVVCWGHQEIPYPIAKSKAPDGTITVWPEQKRIRAVAFFDPLDSDGMWIYSKILRGYISAASIAFVPILAERRGTTEKAQPHRESGQPLGWWFKRYSLTEWSCVTVPSCAGAIRDSFDSEKSFISPKLQKALLPYVAKSHKESGRCFSGWCPCPPCETKEAELAKTKQAESKPMPKSCSCSPRKACGCGKGLRSKLSKANPGDLRPGDLVNGTGNWEGLTGTVRSVDSAGRRISVLWNDGTVQQVTTSELDKVQKNAKQLLESSGPAGGYTVAVQQGTQATSPAGDIACAMCGGAGACPGCEGVGTVSGVVCEACGGDGNCSGCSGVGVSAKSTKGGANMAARKIAVKKTTVKKQAVKKAWLVTNDRGLYLSMNGRWGAQDTSRLFNTQQDAQRVADQLGGTVVEYKSLVNARHKDTGPAPEEDKDLDDMGNPAELKDDDEAIDKGADDPNAEPFTPKASALEAAKAYRHMKDLADYFGAGGEGDLAKMDHPGMSEALKELLDDHLPKAMEHCKSALHTHHKGDGDDDADAFMEKHCKALGGADEFQPGEAGLVDNGDVPPEVEVADEVVEDEPVDEVVEAEGADLDTEEILERYQHPKSRKWLTRTVGVARRAKDGNVYIVRKAQFNVGDRPRIIGGTFDGKRVEVVSSVGNSIRVRLPDGDEIVVDPRDLRKSLAKDLANPGNPAELTPGPAAPGNGAIIKDEAYAGYAASMHKQGVEPMAYSKWTDAPVEDKDLTDMGNPAELKADEPVEEKATEPEPETKSKSKKTLSPGVSRALADLQRTMRQNGFMPSGVN